MFLHSVCKYQHFGCSSGGAQLLRVNITLLIVSNSHPQLSNQLWISITDMILYKSGAAAAAADVRSGSRSAQEIEHENLKLHSEVWFTDLTPERGQNRTGAATLLRRYDSMPDEQGGDDDDDGAGGVGWGGRWLNAGSCSAGEGFSHLTEGKLPSVLHEYSGVLHLNFLPEKKWHAMWMPNQQK